MGDRLQARRPLASQARLARRRGCPGPRMQPRREFHESQRKKKKKGNSLSFAFFCFLLLFGIGTFQRVTAEKSEKFFSLSDSRGGLWSNGSNSLSPPAARQGRRWIPRMRIRVAQISGFSKVILAETIVGDSKPSSQGLLSGFRILRGSGGKIALRNHSGVSRDFVIPSTIRKRSGAGSVLMYRAMELCFGVIFEAQYAM